MSFGLFKNILLVNFKKNWVMVCSFFVFLIVSCAMLFGLTSFIIGMRSQIPSESFAKNKDFTEINDSSIKTTAYKEELPGINALYFKKPVEDFLFQNVYLKTLKELNITDINQMKDFDSIINDHVGHIEDGTVNSNHQDATASFKKLSDYVFQKTATTNLLAYIIEDYGMLNHKFDINYNGKVITPYLWISDWRGGQNKLLAENKNINVITSLDPKTNEVIKTPAREPDGYFSDNKYRYTKNIVYTDSRTMKNNHYKIGQKITLDLDSNKKQEFTFGGIYAPDIKKIYADANNNENYYILNYEKVGDVDIHGSDQRGNSGMAFWFWYSDRDKKQNYNDFMDSILGQWFSSTQDWSKISRFASYHTFYNAFFMLNILLIVILLILNIILAWFLIRVMIDSMSKQILFLKSLGLRDGETSLINTGNILIILIGGIGLGIVSSLGVQAVFTNMITNFMEIILKWYVIQPMTAILIVGLPLLLCIIYFCLNFVLLKKLNVRENAVVKKSEFAFSKFRNFLFNRNINLGITFAFNVKNSIKIIVAFVIVFLMTALTFVCGQFMNSLDQGSKIKARFNNGKDAYSFNFWYGYRINGKDDFSFNIQYKQQDDAHEITDISKLMTIKNWDDLNSDYITRTTLNKWAKYAGKNAEKSLQDFESSYDSLLDKLWPKADKNFRINFGSMYREKNTEVNQRFSFRIKNINLDLVVLPDNSTRAKELFSKTKDTYKNSGYLPVAYAYNIVNDNNLKVGQTFDTITTSFNQDVHFNSKIELATTKYYNEDLVFARQSDFNQCLTEALNKQYPVRPNSDNDYFTNFVIKNILNNPDYFNSFWDKGLPTTLSQFVIPQDFIDSRDWIGGIKEALNINRLHIVDLSKMNDQLKETMNPLSNTLMVLVILAIVMMLVFIVFMVMAIMNENDEIIFIMKALGYSQTSILRRIITGYFVAICLGTIVGLVISWVLLGVLNNAFLPIIVTKLQFYWTWPIGILIAAFVIVLCGITLSISSFKIHARSLTKREE